MIVVDAFPEYRKFNQHVSSGDARWLCSHLGKEFGRYIDGLPWCSNRVDYLEINRLYLEADLYSMGELDIISFFDESVLSKYSNVAFSYLDDFPLLIVKAEFCRTHLTDFLTYAGDAMAFGYDSIEDYCFDDFMVVNSWDATVFKQLDRNEDQ